MQCPTCGNMTNYVEQYGQYYCYVCQAYVAAAQQPAQQQYAQQQQQYQTAYQQQPQAQYQEPYDQSQQPGYVEAPQVQPVPGTQEQPLYPGQQQGTQYQIQYSGFTPGAQQPLGAAPATTMTPGYVDPYGRGAPQPVPAKKGSAVKFILVAVVVSFLVIAILAYAFFASWDNAEVTIGSGSGDEISLGHMRMSSMGSHEIRFIMTDGADLSDLSYQLLNNKSEVIEGLDSDDETISMSGKITDILFLEDQFNASSLTIGSNFYAREPANGTNHTLFVTFEDADGDGKFSDDDIMNVRGLRYNGLVLRLRNDLKRKYYAEIELPIV